MADPHNSSTARPGLSAGAWAAISAVVVALIGAAVTLTTTWWSQHRATAPAAQSAQSTPIVAEHAEPGLTGLVGRWKGVAQAAGQPAQRVEVEITAGCAPGAACGWINVPDVPCKGQISLVGPDPNGLEFQVDRFDPSSDPGRCQPGGGEVLRAAGDGTVVYTATYSGARGVLRPAP